MDKAITKLSAMDYDATYNSYSGTSE